MVLLPLCIILLQGENITEYIVIAIFILMLCLLLFYSIAYVTKLGEMRSDYYAYLKTKDENYANYFSKFIDWKKSFFYPTSQQRINYIKTFPKTELSFKTIILFTVVSIVFAAFLGSLFSIFLIGGNVLIIGSLILIFHHLNKLNKYYSIHIKNLIVVYIYWFLSLFIISLIIEVLIEFEDNFIFYENLTTFLRENLMLRNIQVFIVIPFLILLTKQKEMKLKLVYFSLFFIVLIHDLLRPEFSLIFLNDSFSEEPINSFSLLIIFGITYIISLTNSILKKIRNS